MKYTRITVEPEKMGGMPCIRGLRIPLATVVSMVADGMSTKDILDAYPELEAEDIREALLYKPPAASHQPQVISHPSPEGSTMDRVNAT
ncbi:MAG: DUF433 domain-containing protein [Chloroflexi bacterium]|nr:DUF433 domain-containing protein [Chloroflexota bacterium]